MPSQMKYDEVGWISPSHTVEAGEISNDIIMNY